MENEAQKLYQKRRDNVLELQKEESFFNKKLEEKNTKLAKLDAQIEAQETTLAEQKKAMEMVKEMDKEVLKVWEKCMSHKDEEISRLNKLLEKLLAKPSDHCPMHDQKQNMTINK